MNRKNLRSCRKWRLSNEEQARQIADFRKQLANNPQDKEEITQKFAEEDKIFLSNQKVAEGWKLYYNKDYNEAIKIYNDAIELKPNYDYAYNNRGWAYYCMKNYHQALKDFEKALELNLNNMQAKNNLKLCYEALGKKTCGGGFFLLS